MPYLLGQQRIRAYGSYNSKNNSFMLNTINNGSCWVPRQARCRGDCLPNLNVRNKRINGTVRVSSSEYQMNKASGLSTQNVIFNRLQPKPVYDRDDLNLLQWNQSSDRAFPSRFNKMMKVNVPSHGNSTKTSLTRHRPGAGAGGKQLGVDLKHNSYHRYLLKKKGLKPLRGEKQKIDPWNNINPPPPHKSKAVFDKSVQNNKWRKDSIVANMNLCSLDPDSDCKPKPAPEPKPQDLLKYLSVDDNNYMELTGGKGTKEDPFTGKSTNTLSTGDSYIEEETKYDQTRASVVFAALHPCQVTVNIKSSSEDNYDAAFLLKDNEIISLGSENFGNLTGKFLNDITMSSVSRQVFVGDYGQSGNNKSTTTTFIVGVGDEIKIVYDKDSSYSDFEDAITEFSVYAEPLTSHKELPKSIVQEQDFFKTSLKETEPEKEPEKEPEEEKANSFFNLDPFDYTINTDKIVERKEIPHSEISLLIADKNNEEYFYEKYDPKFTYTDINNNKVTLPLKDINDGVLIKIRKPIEILFSSGLATFNAKWDNEWKVNPPIAKMKDNMLVFDQLQNITLVVVKNN